LYDARAAPSRSVLLLVVSIPQDDLAFESRRRSSHKKTGLRLSSFPLYLMRFSNRRMRLPLTALAQTGSTVRTVYVPFVFQAGNQQMPAGLYRIDHQASSLFLLDGPTSSASGPDMNIARWPTESLT
jgi:hypothetical protein